MGWKRRGVEYNNQQPRSLLPAKPQDRQTGSKIAMPAPSLRKPPIKSACLACQKRKSKCSGERPTCANCASRGAHCLYNTDTSDETHTQALKRKCDQLQTTNTAYEEIYKTLQVAPKADAEALLEQIRSGRDIGTLGRRIKEGSLLLQSAMENKSSVGSPCFQQLRSWKLCRTNLRRSILPDDEDDSTILTLPPRPLDAYKSLLQEDAWTQIGWTKAHIRHLIDIIVTWDYLPFSLFRYDHFLKSFYNESTRFCSSALVCALLALASRIVNEDKDDDEILPSGWIGNTVFLDKATERLQQSPKSLPDIQAIGILSLYHLRCGREIEARESSETFIAAIGEFCKHEPLLGKDKEQYATVRDTTYCGAISLSRILLITTGRLFNMRGPAPQAHVSIGDKLPFAMEMTDKSVSNILPLTMGGNSSQLHSLQFISTKIFQLTEWVYKIIISAHSSTTNSPNELRIFYKQCLDWYTEFLTLAEKNFGRTPFVLFVHMYYHFSLLCAFRPFTSVNIRDPNIWPQRICKEAAQSILALVQSYDDLFSLHRVSGLMPYFVCASGLPGISMETGCNAMNSVHLRLKDDAPWNKARPMQQAPVTNYNDPPATSSYITMSATDHARQLLAKMSSTHLVAKIAENQLQESLGNAEMGVSLVPKSGPATLPGLSQGSQ